MLQEEVNDVGMAFVTGTVQGCRTASCGDIYVSIVLQEEVNDVGMALVTGRLQG